MVEIMNRKCLICGLHNIVNHINVNPNPYAINAPKTSEEKFDYLLKFHDWDEKMINYLLLNDEYTENMDIKHCMFWKIRHNLHANRGDVASKTGQLLHMRSFWWLK